jgi:hypothetical protein
VSICLLVLIQVLWAEGSPITNYSQSKLLEAEQYLNATGNESKVLLAFPDGSSKRITLNPAIYLTYDKVVYESPHGDFKNQQQGEKTLKPFYPKWKNNSGVHGEYRYLGVDISGNTIFNEDFPKDFVSGKKLEDKNWDKAIENGLLWDELKQTNPAIISYILHKPVMDDGALTTYTLMDILKKKTTDEDQALYYIQLQSLPTFYADGVVKLTHSKGAYYDTFNIPKFSLSIEAILKTTAVNPPILDAATPEHTVTVTLDGSLSKCMEDSDTPKALPIDHYTFQLTKSTNTDFNPAVSQVVSFDCTTLEDAKAAVLTLSHIKAGDDLIAKLTVTHNPGLMDSAVITIDLKTTAPTPTVAGDVQILSYDGKYDVLKGIPTHEKLKVRATLDDRAQTLTTVPVTGTATYDIRATRVYTVNYREDYDHSTPCTDTDGDGIKDSCPGHTRPASRTETVTRTVSIARDYTYHVIQSLYLASFNALTVKNTALPTGSATLLGTDFPETMITAHVWHSDSLADHIVAPSLSLTLNPKTVSGSVPAEDFKPEVEAAIGPLKVRSDSLTIEGQVVIDGAYHSGSAPSPSPLPPAKKITLDSSLALRSPLLPDGVDPKVGYKIPVLTANATYSSSATVAYKPLYTVGIVPVKLPVLTPNPVAVHTPVICNVTLYPQLTFDQRVTKDPERAGLVLDAPFTLDFKTSGTHRAIPGYGTRSYTEFVKNKSVSFPFDVWLDEAKTTLLRANTYVNLDLSKDSFTFYMPQWVKEGTYTLTFKTKPENFPEGRTMKGGVYANLEPDSYNAYQMAEVDVSGRLYDFKVHNITDSLWSKLFYTLKPFNPLGTVMFSGTKDKDGIVQPTRTLTLPIMPGKHTTPGYQNLGLKLGYAFLFDIKSLGSYYGLKDYLRITPKFYYLDEQGKNRQEVDLYYHKDKSYFIQIGSDRDKSDRYLGLDNTWLYTAKDDMDQTAEDNEALGLKTRTNTLKGYSTSTFMGRAYKILLSESLRYSIGRDEDCPISDDTIKRQSRMNTQKWFGYYYLPSTTLAVPKGTDLSTLTGTIDQNSSLFLTKGYIVVNFDTIELNKNNDTSTPVLKYTTDTVNEWAIEGYTVGQKGFDIRYGDVVLYTASARASEDFGAGVTH